MADKEIPLSDRLRRESINAQAVTKLHENSDKDGGPKSQHHTLGPSANQSAAGNHTHDGGQSARLTELMADITISGSRGGNAALASLLSALATNFGLKDTTTP